MTVTQYTSREGEAIWSLEDEHRWGSSLRDSVMCLDAPEWIPNGSHTGFDGSIGRVVSSLGVWRDWQ